MMLDNLKTIITLLVNLSGLLALFLTVRQLILRRRAHMLELYRQAFAMMDSGTLRDDRHYVSRMNRNAFETEGWLNEEVNDNRSAAERVARSFDQLGLLVREGLLPVSIVARFYCSPALRCWHQLSPYIDAVRSKERKNQPGHVWEWEHLVLKIIIPKLGENKGMWKGVSAHNKLEDLVGEIMREHRTIATEAGYRPMDKLWEV